MEGTWNHDWPSYRCQIPPDDPDALVFTSPLGKPLRNSNFRRQVWDQAVADAGLPEKLRIHDL